MLNRLLRDPARVRGTLLRSLERQTSVLNAEIVRRFCAITFIAILLGDSARCRQPILAIFQRASGQVRMQQD